MVDIRQDLRQKLSQKVTPTLIMTQNLLLLPSLELHQEIEKELESNPALEEGASGDEKEETLADETFFREIQYLSSKGDEPRGSDAEDSEEKNPFSYIASPTSLQEYLSWNLSLLLETPEDKVIGEAIIGNLNDDGYLDCQIENLVDELKCTPEKVEEILKVVQSLEPAGVGARSVQEALLIQLREYSAEHKNMPPLVEDLIKDHLDDVSRYKHKAIAKAKNVPLTMVEDAIKFIHDYLNPYPGRDFHSYTEAETRDKNIVSPDVIVKQEKDVFVIEVIDSVGVRLRINPVYLRLLEQMRLEPKAFSQKEKDHIKNYIERAKLFLKGIHQRRDTLYRISKVIVDEQRDFFYGQSRKLLKPLTQSQVASALSISESTVSRATSFKFVQLPWNELAPFSLFFDYAQGIKESISELIQKEREKPLSDSEIARLLSLSGLKLARRTVAKYREELGILSSEKRKRQHQHSAEHHSAAASHGASEAEPVLSEDAPAMKKESDL